MITSECIEEVVIASPSGKKSEFVSQTGRTKQDCNGILFRFTARPCSDYRLKHGNKTVAASKRVVQTRNPFSVCSGTLGLFTNSNTIAAYWSFSCEPTGKSFNRDGFMNKNTSSYDRKKPDPTPVAPSRSTRLLNEAWWFVLIVATIYFFLIFLTGLIGTLCVGFKKPKQD